MLANYTVCRLGLPAIGIHAEENADDIPQEF